MAGSAHYVIFPSGLLRQRRRFKLIAGNGEQVGPASESYRDVTDAERGVIDHATAAMEAAGGTGRPLLSDIDVRYEVRGRVEP